MLFSKLPSSKAVLPDMVRGDRNIHSVWRTVTFGFFWKCFFWKQVRAAINSFFPGHSWFYRPLLYPSSATSQAEDVWSVQLFFVSTTLFALLWISFVSWLLWRIKKKHSLVMEELKSRCSYIRYSLWTSRAWQNKLLAGSRAGKRNNNRNLKREGKRRERHLEDQI